MRQQCEILCFFSFSEPGDYDNFYNVIIQKLSGVSATGLLKKRLLVCCIELIQNNLIHNSSSDMDLALKKKDNDLYIEIIYLIDNEIIPTLIRKIDEINSKKINELKLVYNNNLRKPILDNHYTGNGLIRCRIKSGNLIGTYTPDYNTDSPKNKLMIKLKFEDYGHCN